jgi:hypothetical protein
VSTGPPGDPLVPDDNDPLPLNACRYDTFFVKVLVRRSSGQILQGQVTHVATRRTIRFKDPRAIVGFIVAQLAHSAESHAAPVRPEDG